MTLALALLPAALAAPRLPPDCTVPTAQQEGPVVLALTMTPGAELYSRFGHTAVWVIPEEPDPKSPFGTVYNFGVFLPTPTMLVDWLQGRQTYWMGSTSIRNEVGMYEYLGRGLYAQRLDLPPEAARAFLERLRWYDQPEHRAYIYHWLTDNCSTRIRDLLDEVLDGQLEPQHRVPMEVSPRQEVLRHVWADHALAATLHFAFGPKADAPLDRWQTMFLPDRLAQGLDASRVTWPDGVERPLVVAQCELTPARHPMPLPAPPDRRAAHWLAGAAGGAALVGLGRASAPFRPARWALGLAIMGMGLLYALPGTALALVWAVSPLQSAWNNVNLSLASPLSLLWVVVGAAVLRGPRGPLAARLAAALAGLGLLGGLIGATGLTGQDTAGLLGLLGLPLLGAGLATRRVSPGV